MQATYLTTSTVVCTSPARLSQDFAYVEVTMNGDDYSASNVQLFYYDAPAT